MGGCAGFLHPRDDFGKAPIEITTDRALVYPRVIDQLTRGAAGTGGVREQRRS
jgi:hypothetical protein